VIFSGRFAISEDIKNPNLTSFVGIKVATLWPPRHPLKIFFIFFEKISKKALTLRQ